MSVEAHLRVAAASAQFQRPTLPRSWRFVKASLIAGMALVLYLPALGGDFILDDDVYVTRSRLIAAPDGWYRFWMTGQPMDYYPVSNTSLWIEWRLWKTTTGYHVVNLLLHIGSAWLIWAGLQKLAIPGAFLAALLFTVHPVNVESVAWISQRKDLLAIVFFLLAANWYLKGDELDAKGAVDRRDAMDRSAVAGGAKWYWLSVLAFLLAMLSKGSVAAMPLVLLGFLWWRGRRITLGKVISMVPFLLIAIVLSIVNAACQTRGFSQSIRSAGVAERLAGAGAVVWFYLSKALLPLEQAFIYPQWPIQTFLLLWWLPLAAAIVFTVLLGYGSGSSKAKWRRSFLFAWGAFCVALAPVLGFADVGFMRYSLVADHYQHMALIAATALVAAGFANWQASARADKKAAPIVAAVVIGALSILTWQQATLYSGPVQLYSALLAKNPECSLARFNLGNAFLRNHQPLEAIQQYEIALRSDPNQSEAQASFGAALVSIGRPEEAIEHYERAMQLKPDNYDALANMALAYGALQRPAEAAAAAEKAAQMARLHEETALAERIEAWLKSYRAGQGRSVE